MGIKFTTIDSDIGKLFLASTPKGVVRIGFLNSDPEDSVALADEISAEIARLQVALKETDAAEDPEPFSEAISQIHEYLAGKRKSFTFKEDKTLSRGFAEKVHNQISQIPYGQTATYSEIAALVGHPGAARAVGTACGKNQLLFSVPCHRVVAVNGLGGYAGRLDIKSHLLQLESAAIQ